MNWSTLPDTRPLFPFTTIIIPHTIIPPKISFFHHLTLLIDVYPFFIMTMSAGLRARTIRFGAGRNFSPLSQIFGGTVTTSSKEVTATVSVDTRCDEEDKKLSNSREAQPKSLSNLSSFPSGKFAPTLTATDSAGRIDGLPAKFEFTKRFELPSIKGISNKENHAPSSWSRFSRLQKESTLDSSVWSADLDKGETEVTLIYTFTGIWLLILYWLYQFYRESFIFTPFTFEFRGEGTRESPIIVTLGFPQPSRRPRPPPIDISDALTYDLPNAYIEGFTPPNPKATTQSAAERLVSKWSDDTDSPQSALQMAKEEPKQLDPVVAQLLNGFRELQNLARVTISIEETVGDA